MSPRDATFEHEIHENEFATGTSPGPPLESLPTALPRPPSWINLRPQLRECRAVVRHFLACGTPLCGAPVRPNMLNMPKSASESVQ